MKKTVTVKELAERRFHCLFKAEIYKPCDYIPTLKLGLISIKEEKYLLQQAFIIRFIYKRKENLPPLIARFCPGLAEIS